MDIGAAISAAEARKADVVAAFEKEYKALKKARSMGIRNARIVDADRRTVKVRGVRNGFRSGAVFANDRGCPLIARR